MGDGVPRMKRRAGLTAAGAGTAVPDVPLAAPSFGIAAEDGSRSRLIGWVGVPLLIATGFAVVYWGSQHSTPESENSATATEMGSVGWIFGNGLRTRLARRVGGRSRSTAFHVDVGLQAGISRADRE